MFEVQDERFIGSQPDAARSRRTVGVVADHYPLGHAVADDVLGQLKLTGGAVKIVKDQQTLVVALAQVCPNLRVIDQQRAILAVLQQRFGTALGNQLTVVMQHRRRVIHLVFNVDQ